MSSSQETLIDGLPMPRLVGSNYSRWKLKMVIALEAKGLEEVVYGDNYGLSSEEQALVKTEESETNKTLKEAADKKLKGFKLIDAGARMLLTCCMDDKHLDIIEDCKTARAIWNKLEVEYRDKSAKNYHQLLKEYYGLKKTSDQSVSEYVAKVDSVAARLRDLEHPQDDTAVMIRIVQGLTDDFEAITRWWDMTPHEYQTKELLLMNLKKEEHRMRTAGASGEALIARSSQGNKFNSNSRRQRNQGFVKKGICHWCKQTGHFWRDCPTRPKDATPEGVKSFGSNRAKGEGSRHDKVKALCAQVNADDEMSWFFDTGASYHMTGHKEWFTEFKSFAEKIPIKFGDRLSLEATGKGKIRVLSYVGDTVVPIDLEDVWYIPNISNNLFSWGAAAKKGVKLVSEENTMALMDEDGILMTGKLTGVNLWKLNIKVEITANICRDSRTLDEWHKALGHPDTAQIKHMAATKCVEGLELSEKSKQDSCGHCQLGKGKRASHPTSGRERATEVLERVHVDLSGLIEPASLGGAQYFMLIKDEYSGYMHVYFLTTKAHIYDKIRQYVNEVSIKTQKRVKSIRSDNGTEFKNQGMTVLCSKEGILQEFSAPRTPQQNGMIERANRTIGETARTMLQSSKLPLGLWAEAVNSAVYLRNRMTNSVNRDKTPFELFFGHKPSLSHVMPFGQEVYVLDHANKESKFSAKTKEAHMIGYGDRINTYKCIIAGTKDVLITSDVVPATHSERYRQSRATVYTPINFLVGCQDEGGLASPTNTEAGGDLFTEEQPAEWRQPSEPIISVDLPERSEDERRRACTMQPLVDDQIQEVEIASTSRPDRTSSNPNELISRLGNVFANENATNRADAIPSDIGRVNTGASQHYPNLETLATPQVPVQTTSAAAGTDARRLIEGINHLRQDIARLKQTNPRPTVTGAERAQQRVSVSAAQQPASVSAAQQPVSVSRAQQPASVSAVQQQAGVSTAPQQKSVAGRIIDAVANLSPVQRPKRNVKSVYARNLMAAAEHVSEKDDQIDYICPLEPKSYAEALSCDDAAQWQRAIDEELNAHAKNSTWEIVPRNDETREITSKWIFKLKQNAEGKVERYKARLVARGFVQTEGIDYGEIFSPVVRMDSLRLLFSICAQFNLHYAQFDVTTAFLNGEIEEDLYLAPPDGLEIKEGFTCKLRRSLYGLKQAPRCWNTKFVEMLKLFEMRQTQCDSCVFVGSGNKMIFLALYVDDGLIFAESELTIQRVIGYLKKHFEVKLLNSACFLGLEIVQDREKSSIFLHQRGYIKRLLERFKMSDSKGVATPLESGHSLNKPETLKEKPVEGIPYAEAIGSLLYCGMSTRPDIAYALSVLSKFTKEPRQLHWKGVKRVMRYLKATLNQGLMYRAVDEPKVTCYVDADYAGDQQNRRSTSGMVTFINTGPISFKAKQQDTVATSTTQAEYVACYVGVKDLIWITRFIDELGVPMDNQGWLMCDNQGAIRLVKNPEFHDRTKHIETKFHFIREYWTAGVFELRYVQTDEQRADIFTKALTAVKHNHLKEEIGCVVLDGKESRRVLE